MDPITEAPHAFVIWSAISVISAVLKKKVWIDRGTYLVYPNQYIVLVGPPGVGKGTAVHPAHAFIKDYKPELSNYLSDRVTAPKIIEKLADGFQTQSVIGGAIVVSKESTAVLMAMELATFLGSSDWMTSFLCQTWDQNKFEYGTKNKGSNVIDDMCVSLIGACTPDFIRKINGHANASDAVNGGFTARTIFVFANEKSKDLPWPVALKNRKNVEFPKGSKNFKTGQEIINDLRHDLEQVAKLHGQFDLNDEARTIWQDWYLKVRIKDEDSDVVRHFKSRQPGHVLKVAMCLSAASNDSLVIDRWCLQTALSLVQGVLDTLDITFRGVGESSLAEATAKVQNYIERKGSTSRKELVRDNHRHVTMEDLDRILNTLCQIGIVQAYSRGGSQYYDHISLKNGQGKITP